MHLHCLATMPASELPPPLTTSEFRSVCLPGHAFRWHSLHALLVSVVPVALDENNQLWGTYGNEVQENVIHSILQLGWVIRSCNALGLWLSPAQMLCCRLCLQPTMKFSRYMDNCAGACQHLRHSVCFCHGFVGDIH